MKSENILKIVDIDSREFTKALLTIIIKKIDPTYLDQVLKEHIYNIEDLTEFFNGYEYPEDVTSQVYELKDLVSLADAAFFRIIFN